MSGCVCLGAFRRRHMTLCCFRFPSPPSPFRDVFSSGMRHAHPHLLIFSLPTFPQSIGLFRTQRTRSPMRSYRVRKLFRKLRVAHTLACVALIGLLLLCWSPWHHFSSRRKAQRTHPRAPQIPYAKFCDTPVELTVARRQPGSEARHVVLTVATKIDVMTCAHFTSSILSGVSPVVTGYSQTFHPHKKFNFAVEAADKLSLRDWDVVLLLDSDTTFTGEDVGSVMKEFDKRAPAHPDDINVSAVRHGDQWAPMTFHSESYCYAPRIAHPYQCSDVYSAANEALDDALKPGPLHKWVNRPVFLNTGVVLMRVWALREFQRAFELHTQFVPSRIAAECDQSIAAGLYLDMIWSEARLGLVSSKPPSAAVSEPRVNQFGLHYGLLALDTEKRLSVPLGSLHYTETVVTGAQHGVELTTSISSDPFERTRLLRMSEAIVNRSHLAPLFSSKHISDVNRDGSNVIRWTSSLIARAAEAADLLPGNPSQLTFPLLVHTPGRPKIFRLNLLIPLSGWSLALRFVPGYCAEARALVDQSVIRAVMNRSEETSLTVAAICRGHLEGIFDAACEV